MARIPAQLRQEVVAEIYRQFDEMRWEEKTQSERSASYQRLVDAPEIGGVLAQHIPSDMVRLWIKDGPAKEYRRALEGVGPYSVFTSRTSVGAKGVVSAVLDSTWSIVDQSTREKPMRCVVESDRERRLIVWGPGSSLKELFWHAAVHVVTSSEAYGRPLIALTRHGNAPIDAALWRKAEGLGDLVGCDVAQTTLEITRKVDPE